MKPLLLALNLICGADATTTHVALAHGAREVSLPTQNRWMATAMVAGESAGMSYGLIWLDKTQHPKLARGLGWTAVAIRGVIVVNNIHQLRRQQ